MKAPKQTDASAVVVPFGKHKGATVAELLAKDPAYADWVMAQGWVAERFAELHAAIATRGAGTDDTPEHNALQARFLDVRFRLAALRISVGDKIDAEKKSAEEIAGYTRESQLAAAQKAVADYSAGWGSRGPSAANNLAHATRKLDGLMAEDWSVALKMRVQFEVRGVDVLCGWQFWQGKNPVSNPFDVGLELKPTMGDDYPSVMRQMKRLGCQVCIVGQYTGRGVSEPLLRQMFEANGQTLVFVQEIEEEAHKAP